MTLRGVGLCCVLILLASSVRGQSQWPEHRGPNHNYQLTAEAQYPMRWSVATGNNIRWRAPLPETGHSGIAVWNDRLFLTCFRELSADDYGPKGTWVSETRGYCLAADSGKVLWSCELPGKRPNQVNGTFTDSTTPTPVTDGKHVWFVNAGGFMACYTVTGERVWEREFEVRTKHSAKQFQPLLHDGHFYYAMLRDDEDPKRRPQTATDWDKNSKSGWPWMFVRRFDALSGKPSGILGDGISVHSKGALATINGQAALLYARGGSHFPPEKPFGISLARLDSPHDLIWKRTELPLEGSHFVDDRYAYCFDRSDLILLDLATGATVKRIRVRNVGSLVAFDETRNRYLPPVDNDPRLKSKRFLTHRTNIGFGDYHFFLAGVPGLIGRINIETGDVNYLQVPLQVVVENGRRRLSWTEFESGDDTGSGFRVEGDKRRLSHGFGHISAATPIIVNNKIYFTTVLGTVYVVDATAKRFDEKALIAVNDLGPPGKTWTLSPFSAADGRLYQRTSREIICIGD